MGSNFEARHSATHDRPHDPRGHFNLGVCLDAMGEARPALGSFETAFSLQPKMADAGANAAGLRIRRGEAERACTLCYLALKEDPDCTPALYNLNTALRMAGRKREAVAFSWQWIRRMTSTGTAPDAFAAATYTEKNTAAPTAASSGNGDDDGNDSRHEVPPPAMAVGAQGFHSSTNVPKPGAIHSCDVISTVAGCFTTSGGDSERGASGSAGPLTVVCVRWGDKYGPDYVERLASGVRRNMHRRYTFVCFTDDVPALDGMTGVVARTTGTCCGGWKGWWHKAFLFSREAGLKGRVLYIDLDTVVVGPLDDIAAYSGPFAALSVAEMANEHRFDGINSSLMSWDADSAESLGSVYELLVKEHGVITACVHKFDHWLEMTIPMVGTLQKEYPGQVVEYKADCCAGAVDIEDKVLSGARPATPSLPVSSGCLSVQGGTKHTVDEPRSSCHTETLADEDDVLGEGLLPPNARVVCFPLTPKPHEVHHGWVQRHWWGGEGSEGEGGEGRRSGSRGTG